MQDEAESAGLETEVKALRGEVARLNAQPFFRNQSSFWRMVGWNLTRGLSFGLGSVLGATILVAIFVKMLSSIDFIPVLGDWAQRIIEQIQVTPPT